AQVTHAGVAVVLEHALRDRRERMPCVAMVVVAVIGAEVVTRSRAALGRGRRDRIARAVEDGELVLAFRGTYEGRNGLGDDIRVATEDGAARQRPRRAPSVVAGRLGRIVGIV